MVGIIEMTVSDHSLSFDNFTRMAFVLMKVDAQF